MFGSKTDLASLKTNVDNFDVDKLKNVPANLSKPSNVVNNDFVNKKKKKCVWKISEQSQYTDTKIPGTGGLIAKIQCDLNNQDIKKNIEHVVKKTLNTSGLSRRLITIQKLQRLKIRYLVLLA